MKRTIVVIGDFAAFEGHMDNNYIKKIQSLCKGLESRFNVHAVADNMEIDMPNLVCELQLSGGDVIFHIISPGNRPLRVKNVAKVPPGIIKIYDVEDMHPPDHVVPIIRENSFDIVTFRYDCSEIDYLRKACTNVRFCHWRHYIDAAEFHVELPSEINQYKSYDVLIFGNLDGNTYPFRARLARLLLQDKSIKAKHIQHPGYCNRTAHTVGRKLAMEMSKSWFTICTPSVFDYDLKKYAEAGLSGSLPLGRVATRSIEICQEDILQIDDSESDEKVMQVILSALANKEALARKIRRLQQKLRSLHTDLLCMEGFCSVIH